MLRKDNGVRLNDKGGDVYARWSLYVAIVGLVLILLVMLDRAPYEKLAQDFTVANSTRAGSLILPTNIETPRAVMIFVHGDGAMGRSAFGYYYPLWQRFAKQGIASYSWDKAGVGGSDGNWLNQDMQSRAQEIDEAIAKVRQQALLKDVPIGLIGFSQAGWVMPKALKESSQIAFAVFVSTPVNWLKQSEFLTQVRLQREGVDGDEKQQHMTQAQQISMLIAQGENHSAYLDYLAQTDPDAVGSAMSPERYQFVQKNILADSQQDLAQVTQPLFVAFGEHDSNVNVPYNVQQYQHIFANRAAQLQLNVYQNANHTMLKNSEFGHLSPSLWWLIKMSLWEEDGFSEPFVEDVTLWLNTQLTQLASQQTQQLGAAQ
ncbi:alpha/beta hydrolase [Pseudoalteromonas sp. A25]|uniref:alpha/beta hydrolase family protein n=1 Tax=Pseudoalteromonas sp. A25 TaxID=116092 RepID=UPI00126090E6|nr:alpha/beta fold hydrolase [Pseudoalteromonas sp. A25]BBN80654.1 alpha/beta hydrolase [Pseudoalteromonas sp. A25]